MSSDDGFIEEGDGDRPTLSLLDFALVNTPATEHVEDDYIKPSSPVLEKPPPAAPSVLSYRIREDLSFDDHGLPTEGGDSEIQGETSEELSEVTSVDLPEDSISSEDIPDKSLYESDAQNIVEEVLSAVRQENVSSSPPRGFFQRSESQDPLDIETVPDTPESLSIQDTSQTLESAPIGDSKMQPPVAKQQEDNANEIETGNRPDLIEDLLPTMVAPEESGVLRTPSPNGDWVVVDKGSVPDNDKLENGEEKVSEEPEPEENDEIDVLGNGLLKKKVLAHGEGRHTRPLHGENVTIFLRGKLEDGKIVDNHDRLRFTLGDGDVIQALDLTVALMEKGETSLITTDAKYAYGEEGRENDIPPHSKIEYTVTLINIEDKYDFKTMDLAEKIALGDQKRERGNYYFQRGDHAFAINSYHKALTILDDEEVTHTDDPDLHQRFQDTRLKCFNNLAAAQLKVDTYDAAIKSCDSVLKYQPENVKALYRKGKALASIGELEDAVSCMRKALRLEPDSKRIHEELSKLTSLKKEEIEKEKLLYKKMLGTENEQPVKKNEQVPCLLIIAVVVALLAIVLSLAFRKS